MMKVLFYMVKAFLLWLAISAIVWVGSMWRWYSTHANPGAQEVAVTLLIAPAALTASLLFAEWQVKKLTIAFGEIREQLKAHNQSESQDKQSTPN